MAGAKSLKAPSDTNSDIKDQKMKMLQETIRNLHTQLFDNKTKEKENLNKIHHLQLQLKRANAKELMQIPKSTEDSVTSLSDPTSDSSDSDKDVVCVDDEIKTNALHVNASKEIENDSVHTLPEMNGNEARLIGLMSVFLVVYPFGASLNDISTYLQQVTVDLCNNDIETILRKYKHIFREIVGSSSDAATPPSENKWKFFGFESDSKPSNSVACD